MITSKVKVKTRYWFLFVLLVVALVLFPIILALSMGEQYHVVAEEFQSVFYLSICASLVMLAVSLIIGIMFFKRLRRK